MKMIINIGARSRAWSRTEPRSRARASSWFWDGTGSWSWFLSESWTQNRIRSRPWAKIRSRPWP